MGILDGFEPMEIPRHTGYSRELTEAFIATGNECMVKHCTIEERDRMYDALRAYLRNHPEHGVKVARRGDMLILLRGWSA